MTSEGRCIFCGGARRPALVSRDYNRGIGEETFPLLALRGLLPARDMSEVYDSIAPEYC